MLQDVLLPRTRLTYQSHFSRAGNDLLAADRRELCSRDVDSDAAAVDGRDGEAVFVHHLEVGLDGLLGHSRCLLDRLALGSDIRQRGHEDA
jgi:hypothetical protein